MIIYHHINYIYERKNKFHSNNHSQPWIHLSHFSKRLLLNDDALPLPVSCLHNALANAGPQENPFVPSPLNIAADDIAGCIPAKNCCPAVVGRSATT